MRATLVIPTLNEAASVGEVIRRFRRAAEEANRTLFSSAPIDWEVLVVDGRSTDGTPEIAAREGARVLVEPRRGYGRAYKTGLLAAAGDVIATADGDLTYPVETVPALVDRLLREGHDFLSGDRLAYVSRKSMTTEHRIGNWALNLLLRIAYHRFLRGVPGRTLADSQSGFWVFRRTVLEKVHLEADGMAFSEELKIEAIVRGVHFLEVPIRYGERFGPPKLRSWKDGLENLLYLLAKRLALARETRIGMPEPFLHGGSTPTSPPRA